MNSTTRFSVRFVLAGWILPLVLGIAGGPSARGQGTGADYQRANQLESVTRDQVRKAEVRPHWIAGSSRFWHRNDLADGAKEFLFVDPEKGERRPAFDPKALAEGLTKALKADPAIDPARLPFDEIAYPDPNSAAIQFRAQGKVWRFNPGDGAVTEDNDAKPQDEEPANPNDRPDGRRPNANRFRRFARDRSPDDRWTAFIKDHNVWLRGGEGEEKSEVRLSEDGDASAPYESRFYWSPDSRTLAAIRVRKGDERKVYLIESSPSDQTQPKLHSYDYLKPGDKVPAPQPRLFNIEDKKEIPIVGKELFADPYDIRDYRWDKDSRRLTFVYNQRGHQALRVIGIDVKTGAASAIVDEKSETFIDYAGKYFLQWFDETDELIWMSERDGWRHLYLYDAKTGQVKNQITKGEWIVREVIRADEKTREIEFRAGGIVTGQDPYFLHECRIKFDGSGLVRLTDGDGTHQIRYSPDRKYLIDSYSRVDLAPVSTLRSAADGKKVLDLETADISALEATGWKVPERFVAKGRDDKTDIYGVIYRPTNFDPTKRYPVIELIYAGPQGSFVPTSFRPFHSPQALAELGFILVQIDGMGTSNRSKAFHDVCWKNLGDSGFPDRIRWIKAAATTRPWMDISKVGIYGGSAGGQSSTRAVLAHGDFYKVAVSDCGCHDNRMDKIWWNELWMGWPIGPHYAEQSNVTQAHKLQGKLMLTVGELDRNVDPASTMRVANALIKADKDFDLIIIPGGGHGSGESPYGRRRRQDFFVRHLLGVEPRRQP